MPKAAAGSNKIELALADWSADDRQDAIDFALHPANGATAIMLYLNKRNIKASVDTVHRWQKSLIAESARVNRIRQVINDYKGLESSEIIAFVAGSMAEALIGIQEAVARSEENISYKDIQALTSLAKEARSSAIAMQTPHSSASAKELELGYVMSAFDKLEAIFIDDEIVLERIRLACKGILTEIEGSYQG
jgi:hypothetical protein